MHDEPFPDSVWVGIEEVLEVFASLSTPMTCGGLPLCETEGMSDIEVFCPTKG